MQILVSVETWFTGGLVVSFTDEYGVDYRGALLKRTNEPPECKGPNHELANPLSILHDHSYGQFQQTEEKAWNQVPAKVLLGWNSPLTSQHAISKRNGFVRNPDKKRSVVVETDDITNDIRLDWPYFHKRERSAKFLARIKMKDTERDVARTLARKKITSRARKSPPPKLVKKIQGESVITPKTPKTVIATVLPTMLPVPSVVSYDVSAALKKLLPNISPSLTAKARKCTVGISPTKTFHSSSQSLPRDQRFYSPTASQSSSLQQSSSRGSSLSPAHQVKPFSIPLKKIPTVSGFLSLTPH